jgi:hypothetical protein
MQPMDKVLISSYKIENSLDRPEEGAVEVVVTLVDGRQRWCFFFTPGRMALVGDWVEGTRIPLHLGVNHMIVVGELSTDIIDRVLRQLESSGLLLEHTRAFGDDSVKSDV